VPGEGLGVAFQRLESLGCQADRWKQRGRYWFGCSSDICDYGAAEELRIRR
jgi:hypothetical protein